MNNENILNAREAAKLVRADMRTLERRAKEGRYPKGVCGKHGRYWLFNREKLLQYIFGASEEKEESLCP